MFATLFESANLFEFRILSGRSLLAEPQKIPPQFKSLNRAHPVCLLDAEACPNVLHYSVNVYSRCPGGRFGFRRKKNILLLIKTKKPPMLF